MKYIICILQLLTTVSLCAEVPNFSKNAVILVKDKGKTHCFSPDKYQIIKKPKNIKRNLNPKKTINTKKNDVSLFLLSPIKFEFETVSSYKDILYPDIGLTYGYEFDHLRPYIGITLNGWGIAGIATKF